ncbi:MAG: hypothetical protein IJT48_03305, partial [Bacteroidaceae bacterium]|nr:hypothetical protein [Bacteroidaceae bacterium]
MNHKLFLLAALVSTALTMPSHVASRSVCPVPGDSVAAKTRTDTLREVTVKATRLLFVTRKDTVIYDLDAVAQQEGDVLADIVGRMPGLELRGGVLYFKGRMVQRVMVNGVDFERGDTRKAIENLPAY